MFINHEIHKIHETLAPVFFRVFSVFRGSSLQDR
jgi:hypothetical protein